MKKFLLLFIVVIFILPAGGDVLAQGPKRLDEACVRELESAIKRCEGIMTDKSSLRQLSPECRRQIEANQWPQPDTRCGREMQAAGQATISKLMECRDRHISARCRRYFDTESRNLQEKTKRCTDETRRVASICGTGQQASEECFKKHRAELEAACGQ